MTASRADLTANTDTLLYTASSGKKRVVNICLAARSGAANVRLAHTSGGAPASTDYLAYDYPLDVGDFVERTQVWVEDGEKIYVRASAAGVSAVLYGPAEEDI